MHLVTLVDSALITSNEFANAIVFIQLGLLSMLILRNCPLETELFEKSLLKNVFDQMLEKRAIFRSIDLN